MKNLTPEHMRCVGGGCPAVYETDDGRLLIIGTAATQRQINDCGAYVDEDKAEVANLIDPALLETLKQEWVQEERNKVFAFSCQHCEVGVPLHWSSNDENYYHETRDGILYDCHVSDLRILLDRKDCIHG